MGMDVPSFNFKEGISVGILAMFWAMELRVVLRRLEAEVCSDLLVLDVEWIIAV